MSRKKSIALEADKLIHGPRRKSYGPIKESGKNLAKLWSALLSKKLKGDITPSETMLMMAGLKLLRESNKHQRDNLTDLCGYALLAEELES